MGEELGRHRLEERGIELLLERMAEALRLGDLKSFREVVARWVTSRT
jgi:hypothetical protein